MMKYKLDINKEKCKGCFYCVKFCPVQKIVPVEQINEMGYTVVEAREDVNCIGCCNCVLMCSQQCIKLTQEEETLVQRKD